MTTPGYYATTGSTEQTPCPPGTQQPESKKGQCTDCEAGKFMNASGAMICHPCTAGAYCPKGAAAPLPCKQGTYSNAPGLSSPTQCTPAAPGFYATTGSTGQTPCSPGTRQPAPGMGQCDPCDAGTFQEAEGQQTCETCPQGAPLCT